MAKDHEPGRTADSPPASGDIAGNPNQQQAATDTPPKLPDGPDAEQQGNISEEDVKTILTGFNEGNQPEVDEENGETQDPPATEEPEGDGKPPPDEEDPDADLFDGEDADDSDLFDEADQSGEAGAAEGDGDSSTEGDDEPEENAKELDEVEHNLEGKTKDAFARMRVQLKESKKELKLAKAQAEYGEKMGKFLDSFDLDDDTLYDGLLLMSTVHTDPIKGLELLRTQMAKAADQVRERYPQANIDELLTFTPDTVSDTPAGQLPADLQEMVDEGRMSEERAKEIAQAMTDGEKEPEPTVPAQTQKAIDETNEALRGIGFYDVASESELDDRINMLVPAMGKLATKLGMNLAEVTPETRKGLAVRAGKAVLKRIAAGTPAPKPTKKKGRMIRTRDGSKPRQQEQGDHKTWGDVEKAVVAGFNQS